MEEEDFQGAINPQQILDFESFLVLLMFSIIRVSFLIYCETSFRGWE